MAYKEQTVYGALAEFPDSAALLHAAEKVKREGYRDFDCHSPFPIHGMDEAMGLKRSPLGWIVGIMALTGAGLAMAFQGWASAIDYPLIIAGKPYFSYQAYVPITFGLAVLLGAFSAFFGMLALNRLPQPWHPVFFSDRFAKLTNDGFFVSIESKDKKFDVEQTVAFLTAIGGKNIELLQEDESTE